MYRRDLFSLGSLLIFRIVGLVFPPHGLQATLGVGAEPQGLWSPSRFYMLHMHSGHSPAGIL